MDTNNKADLDKAIADYEAGNGVRLSDEQRKAVESVVFAPVEDFAGEAIMERDFEEISSILADLAEKAGRGATPLHMANNDYGWGCYTAVQVARELIVRGADVDAKNDDGDTPLSQLATQHYCCSSYEEKENIEEDRALAALLLNSGADPFHSAPNCCSAAQVFPDLARAFVEARALNALLPPESIVSPRTRL